MSETWKPVPGMEPYEASSHGAVRNGKTGRRLTPSQSAGYPSVKVTLAGVPRRAYVHRMVLMAFVGLPSDGQIALHRDGTKTNNRPENLRWGTASENALDSVAHGTHHHAAKAQCAWGHLLEPWNLYKNPNGSNPTWRQCLACRSARDYSRETRTPLTAALRDRFYSVPS